MEGAASVFTCELLAGLYFPYTVTVLGALYFIARIVFTVGYQNGPNGRKYGAAVVLLTQMFMPILAIVSCILITYKTPRSEEGGVWETVHSDWVGGKLEEFTPPV